jgi:hypothetical protein
MLRYFKLQAPLNTTCLELLVSLLPLPMQHQHGQLLTHQTSSQLPSAFDSQLYSMRNRPTAAAAPHPAHTCGTAQAGNREAAASAVQQLLTGSNLLHHLQVTLSQCDTSVTLDTVDC